MKKAILLVLLLSLLATTVALACDTYPDSRVRFSGGEGYCAGGGPGCAECVVYDQSGDWQACYQTTGGTAICVTSVGGRIYYN
jgi:hypothetical protein